MLAALAIFLAPEITIDLTRPGAPVPAALFGTNLPIQTPISTDITDFFKKQGVTLYRYPNGGSPGWHFQTGTFDFPESQGDNQCALRTLSGVLDFGRAAGAEILLQVNLESGTPQEASALAMATLGQGVRYFEIGNEVFGDWGRGYRSAPQYAADVVAYAAAIKAVYPAAKVGADMAGTYGDGDNPPDPPTPPQDTRDWDRRVLMGAGGSIDFLSYHWYAGRQTIEEPMHVMSGSLKIPEDIARFRQLIAQYAPGRTIETERVNDNETACVRYL